MFDVHHIKPCDISRIYILYTHCDTLRSSSFQEEKTKWQKLKKIKSNWQEKTHQTNKGMIKNPSTTEQVLFF